MNWAVVRFLARALLACCLAWGCGPPFPVPPQETPASLYAEGLLFMQRGYYLRAKEAFQKLRESHSAAPQAALALLRLADLDFLQGDYEKAVQGYRRFQALYPAHPDVAYAVYQCGVCSWRRIPDPDQDPSPAREGAAWFREFLHRWPDHPLAPTARKLLQACRNHLAEHLLCVGDFYLKRGLWESAWVRYQEVIERFGDCPALQRALLQGARALLGMNRPAEARRLLERLLREFPQGGLADEARQLLQSASATQG